jgi:hypothetical protein
MHDRLHTQATRLAILLLAAALAAACHSPTSVVMCRVPIPVTTHDSRITVVAYYEYLPPFQTVCPQ